MSASWAPALAQTAPPTVPGIASPNSSPDRPAALGLGRGARHRHAGLGGVALAVDRDALGADLDDQAADPGVGDDEVARPARARNAAARGVRANRTRARSSKALWTRRRRGRPGRRRASS